MHQLRLSPNEVTRQAKEKTFVTQPPVKSQARHMKKNIKACLHQLQLPPTHPSSNSLQSRTLWWQKQPATAFFDFFLNFCDTHRLALLPHLSDQGLARQHRLGHPHLQPLMQTTLFLCQSFPTFISFSLVGSPSAKVFMTCLTAMPKEQSPCKMGVEKPPMAANSGEMWRGFRSMPQRETILINAI